VGGRSDLQLLLLLITPISTCLPARATRRKVKPPRLSIFQTRNTVQVDVTFSQRRIFNQLVSLFSGPLNEWLSGRIFVTGCTARSKIYKPLKRYTEVLHGWIGRRTDFYQNFWSADWGVIPVRYRGSEDHVMSPWRCRQHHCTASESRRLRFVSSSPSGPKPRNSDFLLSVRLVGWFSCSYELITKIFQWPPFSFENCIYDVERNTR
jgi:hypothetical protein